MYIIKIKTLEGNILKFTKVKKYSMEGNLIVFTDSMTNKIKRFSTLQCEIEEELEI